LKDRATVLATAVLQIVRHARPTELRSHLEAYLRDELSDVARQSADERGACDET
jgi:hypothetical protein